jgi:hypothetical protein
MAQRSSKRLRSNPQRFEDEQATIHYQQQQDRDVQRAIQASLDPEHGDSTDEDTAIVEHDSEEEEEEKEEPASAAEQRWRKEAVAVSSAPFTSPSGPQTTASSPLDLFQLYLPRRLLRSIAANTTAYAHSMGADNS